MRIQNDIQKKMQQRFAKAKLANLAHTSSTVDVPFYFRGSALDLEIVLDQSMNQRQFRSLKVTLQGRPVKQKNEYFRMTTYFLGILLIPYLFMFCQWWKKIVNPAYEVPLSGYQTLADFIKKSKAEQIQLKVIDSAFNKKKIQIIYEVLKSSQIKGFTFQNRAQPSNYKENEFSHFKQNMKPIKSLPIMTDLRWYRDIVPKVKQTQIHTEKESQIRVNTNNTTIQQ